MFKLTGTVQNFDWGDHTAIAGVRNIPPSGLPEAEYWLGVHPTAPSLRSSDGSDLAAVIAADPRQILGPAVDAEFEGLPFLLKLLAAAQPLSIQVHPNQEQAIKGFHREEELGIALGAPDRSYRDRRHKPELICALTSFEAKCGLRPAGETRILFDLFTDPRVAPLRKELGESGDTDETSLKRVVSWLLNLDRGTATDLIAGLVADARRLLQPDRPQLPSIMRFEPDLRSVETMDSAFPGDVGVAVALLLNHLVLSPGEALFLESGVLHSYIGGLGVELMSSSDNVVRGGLTTKNVDVDELLRIVRYQPYVPEVQKVKAPVHRYRTPVRDFSLTRYATTPADGAHPKHEHQCQLHGPEIVMVTSGRATMSAGSEHLPLESGEAAFVPHHHGSFCLELHAADTVVWRAGVGDPAEPLHGSSS